MLRVKNKKGEEVAQVDDQGNYKETKKAKPKTDGGSNAARRSKPVRRSRSKK